MQRDYNPGVATQSFHEAQHYIVKPSCGRVEGSYAQRLTAGQILRWIELYKEKTDTWPAIRSKKPSGSIWDKGEDDQWFAVKGISWRAIDEYIQHGWLWTEGYKAKSLHELRNETGLCHPKLTPDRLEKLCRSFWEHEKETKGKGRYPNHLDNDIWERGVDGQWKKLKGSWDAINHKLRDDCTDFPDVCSLAEFKLRINKGQKTTLLRIAAQEKFKPKKKVQPILKSKQLNLWLRLFHKKEGRWPSQEDKTVWDKDTQNSWVAVEGETWTAINVALRQGYRGLNVVKARSLAEYKEQRRMRDDNRLTMETLDNWIKRFHKKEKRWPNNRDRKVWNKNTQNRWVAVEGETWIAIDMALHKGYRGLHVVQARSLDEYKRQHGMCDDDRLTPEKLDHWISLFHEKEGKWPSNRDTTVWDKDAGKRWVAVEGETWVAINTTLLRGGRGLHSVNVNSLAKYKKLRGFTDRDTNAAVAPARPNDAHRRVALRSAAEAV